MPFKNSIYTKIIAFSLCFFMGFGSTAAYAQQAIMGNMPVLKPEGLNLPRPNQMVPLSKMHSEPVLRAIKIDPLDPFKLEFIIDTKDRDNVTEAEINRLVEYFLAALTIPSKDLWVNLSPHEKDRIVSNDLAVTNLGKDLLEQDYLLKQLTATITHPENKRVGQRYWAKLYDQINRSPSAANKSLKFYNKVWIVPKEAKVYESNNVGFVAYADLSVLTESDYLSLEKANRSLNQVQKINSQVMKEIVTPRIERDVNTGKNFAKLRQIYHSFILAVWFKKKLKNTVFKHYIDQKKVQGINTVSKEAKDQIYNLYLEANTKGLYSFLKKDYDKVQRRHIRRRYYSGGAALEEKNISSQKLDEKVIVEKIENIKNKQHAEGEIKSPKASQVTNEINSSQALKEASKKLDNDIIAIAGPLAKLLAKDAELKKQTLESAQKDLDTSDQQIQIQADRINAVYRGLQDVLHQAIDNKVMTEQEAWLWRWLKNRQLFHQLKKQGLSDVRFVPMAYDISKEAKTRPVSHGYYIIQIDSRTNCGGEIAHAERKVSINHPHGTMVKFLYKIYEKVPAGGLWTTKDEFFGAEEESGVITNKFMYMLGSLLTIWGGRSRQHLVLPLMRQLLEQSVKFPDAFIGFNGEGVGSTVGQPHGQVGPNKRLTIWLDTGITLLDQGVLNDDDLWQWIMLAKEFVTKKRMPKTMPKAWKNLAEPMIKKALNATAAKKGDYSISSPKVGNDPIDSLEMGNVLGEVKGKYQVARIKPSYEMPMQGYMVRYSDQSRQTLDEVATVAQGIVENLNSRNIPHSAALKNNTVYIFPRKPLPIGHFGVTWAAMELIPGGIFMTAATLVDTEYAVKKISSNPQKRIDWINLRAPAYQKKQDQLKEIQAEKREKLDLTEEEAQSAADLEEFYKAASESITIEDIKKGTKRNALGETTLTSLDPAVKLIAQVVSAKTTQQDTRRLVNIFFQIDYAISYEELNLKENSDLALILAKVGALDVGRYDLANAAQSVLDRRQVKVAITGDEAVTEIKALMKGRANNGGLEKVITDATEKFQLDKSEAEFIASMELDKTEEDYLQKVASNELSNLPELSRITKEAVQEAEAQARDQMGGIALKEETLNFSVDGLSFSLSTETVQKFRQAADSGFYWKTSRITDAIDAKGFVGVK